MPVYKDQIGRKFKLKTPPKCIISLVPSLTELLCDLALEDRLVGITKFCVHPKNWRKPKTIIGGTKNLHFDKIEALNPDLIIANKEENNRDDIEKLSNFYPVYVSDIASFDDVNSFIVDMGNLSANGAEAKKLNAEICDAIDSLRTSSHSRKKIRALYLIWKDPYMAAGTDTFITEMLNLCGIKNCLTEWGVNGLRYPEISSGEIRAIGPDLILLSSEPYPFKEKHLNEMFTETQIPAKLVDGEAFSWYGSRIITSKGYLRNFIHDIFPINR